MRQFLLGGLIGGILFFAWGAVSWLVVPFNSASLHSASNEEAILVMMKDSMRGKGMYALPAMPRKSGVAANDDLLQKQYAEKLKAGPTALVVFNPHGSEQMRLDQMVYGLVNSIMCALIGAWFLMRSTAYASTYIARVAYFGMLGVLVSFFVHLSNYNWFDYPADFTVAMVLDAVLGWVVAGLGVAAIVRQGGVTGDTAVSAAV